MEGGEARKITQTRKIKQTQWATHNCLECQLPTVLGGGGKGWGVVGAQNYK